MRTKVQPRDDVYKQIAAIGDMVESMSSELTSFTTAIKERQSVVDDIVSTLTRLEIIVDRIHMTLGSGSVTMGRIEKVRRLSEQLDSLGKTLRSPDDFKASQLVAAVLAASHRGTE